MLSQRLDIPASGCHPRIVRIPSGDIYTAAFPLFLTGVSRLCHYYYDNHLVWYLLLSGGDRNLLVAKGMAGRDGKGIK